MQGIAATLVKIKKVNFFNLKKKRILNNFHLKKSTPF